VHGSFACVLELRKSPKVIGIIAPEKVELIVFDLRCNQIVWINYIYAPGCNGNFLEWQCKCGITLNAMLMYIGNIIYLLIVS
jgi:hypothetical protein